MANRNFQRAKANKNDEFYTPLVPKGHDFLEEIKKLSNSRQFTQATCEAEVAGVD